MTDDCRIEMTRFCKRVLELLRSDQKAADVLLIETEFQRWQCQAISRVRQRDDLVAIRSVRCHRVQ